MKNILTDHITIKLGYSIIGFNSLFFLSACNHTSRREGKDAERYNIVYIMTDDHTAQMMSCYDKRHIHTPNLDRIAADGVRFTSSFVANSLSGPSRACMLTGKHSHTNGFTDNTTCVFDSSQQTMPKLLKAAPSCCNRPDTKRPSSANGISKVYRQDLPSGRFYQDKETITIRTSSPWTTIPYKRKVI